MVLQTVVDGNSVRVGSEESVSELEAWGEEYTRGVQKSSKASRDSIMALRTDGTTSEQMKDKELDTV